jgi:3-oxoacyl-[acyl-carrier-protein] synthase II
MDRFVHYGAAALRQALQASGLEISAEAERIGMCIGSGMGGLDAQHNNSAALATKGARRVSPFYVPAAIGNIASGLLSIEHGVLGPNLSMQTACATANHSLITACMIIKQDMADVMLAGGTEGGVTELAVAGFANMRALSTKRNDEPQRASRPYDADRDGFVIAEGAGVFVVEEMEHAKKRGAPILCEILSFGMSGDAHDLVIPDPEGNGAFRSMKMALDRGRLEPMQINYINTHGTATPLGDVAEARAVKRLIGSDESNVCVGSTKSMHGHMLGAAAAVEGIICIEAMRHGLVPPNINIDDMDPDVAVSCIYTEPVEKEVRVAFSNSFGFGGHNSTLVFAKV